MDVRRTSVGRPTDVQQTSDRRPTHVRRADVRWTSVGHLSEVCWTSVGRLLDVCRRSVGHPDVQRTDVIVRCLTYYLPYVLSEEISSRLWYACGKLHRIDSPSGEKFLVASQLPDPMAGRSKYLSASRDPPGHLSFCLMIVTEFL